MTLPEIADALGGPRRGDTEPGLRALAAAIREHAARQPEATHSEAQPRVVWAAGLDRLHVPSGTTWEYSDGGWFYVGKLNAEVEHADYAWRWAICGRAEEWHNAPGEAEAMEAALAEIKERTK